MGLDLSICLAAAVMALALKPWRAVSAGGPPWPWLAWWAGMPALWAADRIASIPIVQPLSGVPLLVLLAGWPLTILALLPVAGVTMVAGGLEAAQALHRLAWLGVVPATLALALGTALRRWLPHHLFIYILGRGFFATMLAMAAAGAVSLALHGAPAGSDPDDILIGRWLAASGEAFLTGMFTAIFVAFRPQWLATYSDRLYLGPVGRH